MPRLEYDTEASDPEASTATAAKTEPKTTVVELPTEDGRARVRLPADASTEEVAALVTAVTARLGEEPTDSEAAASADGWRLAGRLGVRRRCELPRECRRGGEWKAASRCP